VTLAGLRLTSFACPRLTPGVMHLSSLRDDAPAEPSAPASAVSKVIWLICTAAARKGDAHAVLTAPVSAVSSHQIRMLSCGPQGDANAELTAPVGAFYGHQTHMHHYSP
ncbi:MAG: hypothetical protein L0Y37_07395, partial [Bacteroidales bacterium]|nr:hypothetical protein [Bacteroidales bacterium]